MPKAEDRKLDAAFAALQAAYPAVSREQAIDTFAYQERYSLLATDLETSFPGNFAGAWIDHDNAGILVIAMTDSSKAEALLPDELRGRVQFSAVERSLQELLRMTAELNEHIDLSVGEASPDIKNNGIWVELLDSAMRTERQDVLLQAAARGIEDQGAPIIYRVLDAMPIEDACSSASNCNPLAAGAAINGPSSCSSGFKMKKGSTLGMLTAKHCSFGNYSHYIYNVLTSTGGAVSSVSDVRFLATTGALSIADDVYSFGTLKDMSGYANPVLDQTVCRGGRNSSDCGVVANTNVSGDRFKINNLASCGGDSGGPVYMGSTAYGTHQSSTETTCPGPSNETSYAVKITSAITWMLLTFQSS